MFEALIFLGWCAGVCLFVSTVYYGIGMGDDLTEEARQRLRAPARFPIFVKDDDLCSNEDGVSVISINAL
jgi:hypothetical protein